MNLIFQQIAVKIPGGSKLKDDKLLVWLEKQWKQPSVKGKEIRACTKYKQELTGKACGILLAECKHTKR